MEGKSTLETVQEIAHSLLGVDTAQVTPGSRFNEDLGADSLDRMEITMAIEEEFDIHLPDEEADQIFTVAQAVEVIDRKIKAKQ